MFVKSTQSPWLMSYLVRVCVIQGLMISQYSVVRLWHLKPTDAVYVLALSPASGTALGTHLKRLVISRLYNGG